MSESMLHGREVICVSQCRGEEYRGTIRSGHDAPHPFRVIDESGNVLRTFDAATARALRAGEVSDMALVDH